MYVNASDLKFVEESEKKLLDSVLESAEKEVLGCKLNVVGHILWVNDTWEKCTGFTPSQVRSKKPEEVFHPNDVAPFLEGLEQLVHETEQVLLNARIKRSDGSYIDVKWYLCIPGDEALIMGFGQVTRESPQVEDYSKVARQLQRIAIKNMRVGLWGWDLVTNVVWFDQPFYRLLDYRSNELKQNPTVFEDLVHPDDWDNYNIVLRKAIDGDSEVELEYRLKKRDGTYIWVLGQIALNRKQDGQIAQLAGSVQDISDYKAAEASNLAYQQELREASSAIELKTSELGELIHQLQLAQAEAETAIQAQNQFLSSVNQEIRNPLNALVGLTSLMLDTPLNEEQDEFMRSIRLSSDELISLLNDVLDYSLIDQNLLGLQEIPFDINGLLEETIELVESFANRKEIGLGYLMAPEMPATFNGDSERIKQILYNLLTNAVRFTDKGEVLVSVDSTPMDMDFYKIMITVRDTGLGMTESMVEDMFLPPHQKQQSLTRERAGLGIGMPIIYQLVKMMGGEIEVDSQVGLGTTVRFYVVLEAIGEKLSETVARQQEALIGRRALLFSKAQTCQRILMLQMHQWQMVVDAVDEFEVLLQKLSSDTVYDFCILDVDESYYAATRLAYEVRKVRTREELPLIWLSALPLQRQNQSLGFSGQITKPIRLSALRSLLYQVCTDGFVDYTADVIRNAGEAKEGKREFKIILAEDNAINRKTFMRILQQLGYSADAAINGLEVIQLLEKEPYDLILMDIKMPKLDGLQTTRIIRDTIEDGPLIVGMTANVVGVDREVCMEWGMDEYLQKPLKPMELQKVLDALLKVDANPPAA